MKKTESREPILLVDQTFSYNTYVGKVHSCEKQCAKFKEVFNTVVTENLAVQFSKEWIKITLDGQLEDRLYDELTKFLSKQPKLMHKAITEEFYRISAPLNEAVNTLRYAFEELPYESKVSGSMFPDGIASFASLPIDEHGNFDLSEEWQTATKAKFKVWVTTDQQFEKYDLLNDLISLKARFTEVHKANAPFFWNQLTQSNEITTNLKLNSIL